MLRQLFPHRRARARALGAWAAVSALALALGPVIGGGLVAWSGWRAIFWFNLALGTLAFAAAVATLPETSDERPRRIDIPGAALSTLAIAAATFAIIQGEDAGYTNPTIIGLGVLAVAALGFFLVVERHRADPLVDLSFFRKPAFTGATVVAFVAYFGIFSIFFFTALYLQVVVGLSAAGWHSSSCRWRQG